MIDRRLPTELVDYRSGQVAGDEVYGAHPHLRADLKARGIGYVLAVACDHQVALETGAVRVDTVAAAPPSLVLAAAVRRARGKGPRLYDWAWSALPAPRAGPYRWLLIRRDTITGEPAFYHCFAPRPVPLSALVRAVPRHPRRDRSHQPAGPRSTPMNPNRST